MGAWQHGMNPVTFFVRRQDGFFPTQICCDGSEIIGEKRPTSE